MRDVISLLTKGGIADAMPPTEMQGGLAEATPQPPRVKNKNGVKKLDKARDEEIIKMAVAAMSGHGEDPEMVLAEFIDRFGEAALGDLMSRVRTDA